MNITWFSEDININTRYIFKELWRHSMEAPLENNSPRIHNESEGKLTRIFF